MPDQTLSEWRMLYDAADAIKKLEPWKSLEEHLVAAIDLGDDNGPYFVSVMGTLGEHFAVAFYEGADSFFGFCNIQMTEGGNPEDFLLHPGFQVSFEDRKEVLPTDKQVIDQLKRKYRGPNAWPLFRRLDPARLPWQIAEAQVPVLRQLAQQALEMLQPANLERWVSCDSELFSLRRRLPTGDWGWTELEQSELTPSKRHLRSEMPAISPGALVKTNIDCELLMRLVPAGSIQAADGGASVVPFVMLLVESKSGLVWGSEIISTEEGIDGAFARAPGAMLGILQRTGRLPKVLAVAHPLLAAFAKAVSGPLGFKVEQQRELPAANEALESLTGFFRSRR